MKNTLPLFSGYAHLRGHSFTAFTGRYRLRQTGWLIVFLTSLSTLSWGQCFNPTTIPLINPVTIQVGFFPTAAAIGDFNGDGKSDMAVANSGSGNVSVLLGNGSGGFGAVTTVAVGAAPYSVTTGDFNGDGKADLATVSGNSVSVLLGNGSGGFGTATAFSVVSSASFIATGDFNGDGKVDLVTSAANTVLVLLGKGDGSFGVATAYAVGQQPKSVAIGDFNSDNKADLAVVNYASNSVSLLLGKGDGSFGPATAFTVGASPNSIVTGDFNGDGRPDLAAANYGINTSGLVTVSVLLGNGSGGFNMAPDVVLGNITHPYFIATGDFNTDGKTDLVTVNPGASSISVRLGNGSGGFGMATDFSVGKTPVSVAVGDFNGDGKPDLAVVNTDSYNVSVLLGKGDGSFGNMASEPRFVASADFNGDGRSDLAIANKMSNNVSILLANSSGGFGAATNFAVGTGPTSIAVGDFNGDGSADLVITNAATNNATIMLGNGSGSFGMAPDVTVGEYPVSVAVLDYNGDGKLDFVTAGTGVGSGPSFHTITIRLGDGTGGFINVPYGNDGQQYNGIGTGDFDGDGKSDLILLNGNGNRYSVFLSKNNGGSYTLTGVAPVALIVKDFNGDGLLDFATANAGSNNISVLLGNGKGSFTTPVNYPTGNSPYSIVAGDFNGDGKIDLATANQGSNNVSVLPGNGSGIFGTKTDFLVGSSPYSVAAGDFNGDGKPDLATANSVSNDVTALFNCSNTVPANTAPTVANAIPNQSGTVGQAFSYMIPANTFTDVQTPNGLTLSAMGLPAGLSLAGTTISGTPSASGISTVTIQATDPGSLAVSTNFTITINPAGTPTPPPTPPGSLTITTFTCNYTGSVLSSVNFVVGYSGGTFTPALPNLFINGITVTGQLGQTYAFGFDANASALPIQDQATRSTYFVWDFRAACAAGSTPPSPPLATAPVAPALPNQAAIQNTAFSYVIPAFTGTAPITYAASGLPAGLSFNAATRTITGTPTTTGGSTVLISATNSAGAASGTFTLIVNAPAGPPVSPGSLTVTTFTCNYTGVVLSSVNFVLGYSGGSFTPALPNLFINGVTITGQLGVPYSFGFDANQSFLPIQDQASRATYFVWNFRAACGGGSVRLGAEPVTAWQAQLLGNPVKNEVAVSISGAQGQSLQLELTNLAGLVVATRRIQPTSAEHQEVFDVQRQAGGLLLLQVAGDNHRQTLKVLKQ